MTDHETDVDEVPRVGKLLFFGSIAGLVAVAVIGIVLVFKFVDDEKQRDLQSWQLRLNIVADTRVAAINTWVDNQFATVRELVENESLQFYMTEIALVR